MLIFTRKIDEEFSIGPNQEISIKILGFPTRNMVKIGITAPKDIPVHRKEVWTRILKEIAIDEIEEGNT